MRHLIHIVPLVALLFYADALVSRDRSVGWERNTVRNSLHRQHESKTDEVVLLGSSTSADWLLPPYLAKIAGRKVEDVLDAHINGCHQPCTWAEVRGLLDKGRHFKVAFFGTSLFQQCEHTHSKRQLQDEMMLPSQDLGRLFALYLHGDDPLNYMARYLGMAVSGAYGDTEFLQQQWARGVFGAPKDGQQWRWATTQAPPPGPVQSCGYAPAEIAYKTAVTSALLDDLDRLADRTYFMLLPDATLAEEASDPEIAARWEKHRTLHRELLAAHPKVRLLDLTTPEGARLPAHFRDGVHLSPAGMRLQQPLFEKRLQEVGGP